MKKLYRLLLIFNFFIFQWINIPYICDAKVTQNSVSGPNDTTSTNRLERIKEKGVLTIVSSNNPPYSFLDPKTGEVTGIDGDIITEVSKRLGINKVEMKYAPFDKLFTAILEDDEIDMIVDATYITEERKKYVSFTNPWYKDYDIFVVPQLSKIQFKEELKDAVVGVQSGTIDEPFAEKLKQEGKIKDFVLFSNQPELLEAVNYSKVDAGISDAINFPYLLKQYESLRLRELYEDPAKVALPGKTAAAVRPCDTALLNAVNEKVNEMKWDKTFEKILAKYGVNESLIIPPPPYIPHI